MEKQKGITLIALVVTIIVLLILAGITISLVVGQNGIITRANQAKLEQRGASVEEQANLWRADNEIAQTQGKQYYESDTQIINRLHGIGLLTDDDVKEIANSPNKEVTIGSRTISFKLEEIDKTALKIRVTTGEDGIVGLPLTDYNSSYVIDWGDGTIQTFPDNSNIGSIQEGKKVASTDVIKEMKISAVQVIPCPPHTYAEKNKEYIVTITGKCAEIDTSSDTVTEEKILEIVQWGETGLEYITLANCSNLVKVAEPSEKSFENVKDFDDTFYGCSSLRNIPENLFANCPNVTSFDFTFKGCSSLRNIPENLFANCPNVTSFNSTFEGCSSLTNIPENLFANCSNVENFMWTFGNCLNLTGVAPELWTRGTNMPENNYVGNPDGGNCFINCTKLQNYEQIPDYWKIALP